MNRIKLLLITTGMVFIFSSCATLKEKFPLGVEQTAQSFFDDLQKSNNRGAYSLFAKGLSQAVSFDQFDEFMQSIREQWGESSLKKRPLCRFIKDKGRVILFL